MSCVLLACAGRRLFDKAVGISAGFAMAFYAPAIFYDGLFHKTALAALLLCLLIYILSILADVTRPKLLWFFAGFVAAALILTRQNALILVAGVVFWLFVHYRRLPKQGLVFAVLFLSGTAVLLMPVAIRNRIVGGEFILTTSNFGRNLYIGNNENADGCYKPLVFGRGHPLYELADDTSLAQQAAGGKLSAAQVSRYWTGRAVDYITAQPGHWLKLMAGKFVLLFNAAEILDTEDLYSYADWSKPLRLANLFLHFGVVCPLALAGLIMTWHKKNRLWLFYLLPALYAVSVLVFYIFGRYRYPLVPFAILFASAAVCGLRHRLRSGTAFWMPAAFVSAFAAAVFCNWPVIPKDAMQATTYNNVAGELMLQGKIEQAVENYQRALSYRVDYPSVYNNLGFALETQGNLEQAQAHYRKALMLRSNFFEACRNLARLLSMQGSFAEAAAYYNRALAIRAEQPQVNYNLAGVLRQLGRTDEAVEHYYKSLEIEPGRAEVHFDLANALKSQGRLDEAADHYRKALRLSSLDADVHNNLGNTLGLQGKFGEAADCYRRALMINPDYAAAHNNLGAVLIRMGSLEEALEHFQKAAALEPDWPGPLVGIAEVLTTHPEPNRRDVKSAIEKARRAAELTKHQNAAVLETLAAAYAASGRFEEALAAAEAALKLSLQQRNQRLTRQIRRRIELYKKSK